MQPSCDIVLVKMRVNELLKDEVMHSQVLLLLLLALKGKSKLAQNVGKEQLSRPSCHSPASFNHGIALNSLQLLCVEQLDISAQASAALFVKSLIKLLQRVEKFGEAGVVLAR